MIMKRYLNNRKKNIKKRKSYLFMVFLFVCIMLIYYVIYYLKKDKISSPVANNIINNIQNNEVDDILIEVNKLYEENNDLVGYIIIPDTVINYPVMYTGDDYYLRRSFQKEYLDDGTLYIDKYNTLEPRDTNLIIYGHNMSNNGHMFNDLEKFRDETFYKTHRLFYYYTLNEKQTYEIVAVFLSQVYYVTDDVFKYYKFYNANTPEEMAYFNHNIKKLSLFDTGIDLIYGDVLLTLSTCEYSKENGRLVVVARKVNNE